MSAEVALILKYLSEISIVARKHADMLACLHAHLNVPGYCCLLLLFGCVIESSL